MPIYEYLCKTCGSRFEALVSIGGEKRVTCSRCGGNSLEKLVSAFGIGGGSNRIKATSDACTSCSATSCSTCK
ncbi:MAG: zinc ribbon domain-containing protein [Candidatus Aminicenantales bacterium]